MILKISMKVDLKILMVKEAQGLSKYYLLTSEENMG